MAENQNEKHRHWYCEVCGVGYAEWLACEEPDCGAAIYRPPQRPPLSPDQQGSQQMHDQQRGKP